MLYIFLDSHWKCDFVPSLDDPGQNVDGDGEDDGAVVLRGDAAQSLQVTQLGVMIMMRRRMMARRKMMMVMIMVSMGIEKMMVLLFSAEMLLNVCR